MKNSFRSIIGVLVVMLVIVFSIFFYLSLKDDDIKSSNNNDTNDVSTKKNDKNQNDNNTNNNEDKSVNESNNLNNNGNSANDGAKSDSGQGYTSTGSVSNGSTSNILPDTDIASNGASDYVSVQSFSINVPRTFLAIGESTDVVVSIFPNNASEKNVSFSSSDNNIAVISRTGLITGVSSGVVNISVTVNNLETKTFQLTVTSYKSKVNSKYRRNYNVNTNNNGSDIDQKNESDTNNGGTSSKNNSSNTNNGSTSGKNNSSTNNNGNSSNNDSSNNKNNSDNKNNSSSNNSSTDKNNSDNKDNSDNKNNSNSSNDKNSPNTVLNGWVTKNGKKYYYKNGKMIKDEYVDYIYLDKDGVAMKKVGNFDATMYGAIGWVNQNANLREKANQNAKSLLKIPTGSKIVILSDDSDNSYIKVKYNNKTGYVYSSYILINLPDIMPDMIYNITNADNSIFKTADTNIPGVTGKALYGYTKKYNKKIGKTTYYAPLLYPVSKQLQSAYKKARDMGYNIKVYDTYRPYDVAVSIYQSFINLYYNNDKIYKRLNYDNDGYFLGPNWFLAKGVSGHNKGTDMDITLTDKNGKELKAQTPMHTLDPRSLVKYNNKVSNKLRDIMSSVGFVTLKSEWWHFQEDDYISTPVNSFRLN